MQPQCSAVAAAATVTADGGEEPQSDQRTARERRTARLICSVRVSSGATGSFSAACEQRQALTTDCVRRSAAHTNTQTNKQTCNRQAAAQTKKHTHAAAKSSADTHTQARPVRRCPPPAALSPSSPAQEPSPPPRHAAAAAAWPELPLAATVCLRMQVGTNCGKGAPAHAGKYSLRQRGGDRRDPVRRDSARRTTQQRSAAQRGGDRTGVATCGTLCQLYRRAARRAEGMRQLAAARARMSRTEHPTRLRSH